jgi:hypothetical protein
MKLNKQQKPSWYAALKETPWSNLALSEEHVRKVTSLANQKIGQKRAWSPLWISTVSLLVLLLGLTTYGRMDEISYQLKVAVDPSWKVRSAAWDDNVKIFEGIPGGDYTAGQRNGSWWNLYLPYDEVWGRKLRIDAIHRESGQRIREVPEMTIDSPSFAYDDFIRISSRFDLPIGGLWKFEMYLDDRKLGDVVFHVPEGYWEPSRTFQHGTYLLRGEEGRLGILNTDLLRVGAPNKYMWFFWGENALETQQLFGKDVTITGTKQGDKESIIVFEGSLAIPNTNVVPLTPNNEQAAQVPTSMSLPSEGNWRLDAEVDGVHFGSVFVEVWP